MDKIIQIDKLSKNLKGQEILSDLSLNIERGEIVGILGPNGAGKTTLLKSIVGLTPFDQGSISISGIDIVKNRVESLKKIGALIDRPKVYDNLTGRENLKYFSIVDKVAPKEIEEMIKIVNLGVSIDRKVSSYSLGMKQRLGIALTFLSNPEIVILDEPTNGLDIEGIIDLYKFIKEVAERKKTTFIITSHNLNEIKKHCTKVIIIKQGRLIFEKELKKNGVEKLEDYYLNIVSDKEKKEK